MKSWLRIHRSNLGYLDCRQLKNLDLGLGCFCVKPNQQFFNFSRCNAFEEGQRWSIKVPFSNLIVWIEPRHVFIIYHQRGYMQDANMCMRNHIKSWPTHIIFFPADPYSIRRSRGKHAEYAYNSCKNKHMGSAGFIIHAWEGFRWLWSTEIYPIEVRTIFVHNGI